MTGFRLYNENFRHFFKASWLMALLYALCCGAAGTVTVIKLPEILVAVLQTDAMLVTSILLIAKVFTTIILLLTAISLVAFAAMSLASATILNKLKEHKDTGTVTAPLRWLSVSPRLMGRTLKASFLTLLLTIIPMVLFFALMAAADKLSHDFLVRHSMTVMGTFVLWTLVVMVLALPLMHVLMKYLMGAVSYWSTLKTAYGAGMRHWGALFLVFFLSQLPVQLVAFVVMTPAHILNFANQQAYTGLLIGDPLGMPPYMTAVTFGTFALCAFIQFYVFQVTMLHNYYVYGSIETKEEERNKQ
jgi:hypothetical protein